MPLFFLELMLGLSTPLLCLGPSVTLFCHMSAFPLTLSQVAYISFQVTVLALWWPACSQCQLSRCLQLRCNCFIEKRTVAWLEMPLPISSYYSDMHLYNFLYGAYFSLIPSENPFTEISFPTRWSSPPVPPQETPSHEGFKLCSMSCQILTSHLSSSSASKPLWPF